MNHEHIGKIDAVGTVQVFGYSAQRSDRYSENLIYLNFAGPPTAADSVWARLIDNRLAVDFTDLRGRPHRIGRAGYPGLIGNEAPFKRFSTRIEHLAIDHCILLDKRFFEPVYDLETSLTFVFEDENMAEKVGQHVSQCVDIAVFPEWHAGLPALGRRSRLILPLRNYGGRPVYQVTLDRARWTQIISLAVEQQELTWPGQEPSQAARQLLSAPVPQSEPEPEQPARQLVYPSYRPAPAAQDRRPPLSTPVSEPEIKSPVEPAPAYRSRCPQVADPVSPFLRVLAEASGQDIQDGNLRRLTGIADQLIAVICEHTVLKDFWETPSLCKLLQARLTVLLDDCSILPYEQLDIVVSRLIELARQHDKPKPTGESKSKFTLQHEGDWTWLSFEKKPDEWVLARLKSAGFRWGRTRRAWYSRHILEHDAIERLLA